MTSCRDDWDREIAKHLDGADVVLLCVSLTIWHHNTAAGGGTSPRTAIGAKCGSCTVLFRDSDWQSTAIGQLQALPKGSKAVDKWGGSTQQWTTLWFT